MMKPTIHLNGTSASALVYGYVAAMLAVEAAIDKVAQASPNGRDYYPQGDDAFAKARAEHNARLQAMGNVANELRRLAEHCDR